MPIGDDTVFHRGRLPHLAKPGRTYYVTFCTRRRETLLPRARDVVLEVCVDRQERGCWIDCLTVMPDHVHLILMPYEETSLEEVLAKMKGLSSYRANREIGRSGTLWQRESFDRILRAGEDLAKKREYIFNNAVRAGLVERAEDYRWNWWSGGF